MQTYGEWNYEPVAYVIPEDTSKEIDFETIIKNVTNQDNLIWNFSYYSDDDIIKVKSFCRRLNIPQGKNVRLFQMSDINDKSDSHLFACFKNS